MLVSVERGGKSYKAIVPDDAPPEHWAYGIVIGPPDFEEVLPYDLAYRLHQELFVRGLITFEDVRHRNQELLAAWQSALKYDAGKIYEMYAAMPVKE